MIRNSCYFGHVLSRYSGVKLRCSVKNSQEAARQVHFTHHHSQLARDSIKLKPSTFNIKNNSVSLPLKESLIKETNVELDDLEVYVSDEKPLILNLTWLRDSCHCDKCTHQYSRQRLITVKDFRREMFSIKTIQIEPSSGGKWIHSLDSSKNSDDTILNIEWSDSHKSTYSMNWLRYIDSLNIKSQLKLNSLESHFIYPEDDLYLPTESNNLKPECWDVAKIDSNLTPVDYRNLIDGFKFVQDSTFINANQLNEMSRSRFDAILSLTRQLVQYGIAKIVNVPKERDHVLKVARSLAYERPTGYGVAFDVVVEPSEEINLAYSTLEFDLHSDLTYREISPGVQLLHCIKNSTEGGLSYFSDSNNAAEILKQSNPILFDVLVQFPMTFTVRDPYRNIKFRRQQPVISLDLRKNLSDIYYSPFMLPPIGFLDDVKLFYLALDKFTRILQNHENKKIAKMDPGDLFIFHNRRVLHGRSAYSSSRFLQGCYMDWDEIRCLYEKMHTHDCS